MLSGFYTVGLLQVETGISVDLEVTSGPRTPSELFSEMQRKE